MFSIFKDAYLWESPVIARSKQGGYKIYYGAQLGHQLSTPEPGPTESGPVTGCPNRSLNKKLAQISQRSRKGEEPSTETDPTRSYKEKHSSC